MTLGRWYQGVVSMRPRRVQGLQHWEAAGCKLHHTPPGESQGGVSFSGETLTYPGGHSLVGLIFNLKRALAKTESC